MCVRLLALLQGFQVYYQKGSLYKLRALGERHRMDVSVGESWEQDLSQVCFAAPTLLLQSADLGKTLEFQQDPSTVRLTVLLGLYILSRLNKTRLFSAALKASQTAFSLVIILFSCFNIPPRHLPYCLCMCSLDRNTDQLPALFPINY